MGHAIVKSGRVYDLCTGRAVVEDTKAAGLLKGPIRPDPSNGLCCNTQGQLPQPGCVSHRLVAVAGSLLGAGVLGHSLGPL